MLAEDQYQLLDFGNGRKLERFGSRVIDRPCPPAAGREAWQPSTWPQCNARYDRTDGTSGRWTPADWSPDDWMIHYEKLLFRLKPTPFGHVGIFPEQARHWSWIGNHIARAANRPKVLNLFGYTGGSTLAAAAAGADVVHVDSAKNMVTRARENAERSGLAPTAIRWMVEDAPKFVSRELKRGNTYDAVILDPPSYGHGPKGEVWKLEQDLLILLEMCGRLTRDRLALVLLTCHSPGFGPERLNNLLAEAIPDAGRGTDYGEMRLESAAGPRLVCGAYARWAKK